MVPNQVPPKRGLDKTVESPVWRDLEFREVLLRHATNPGIDLEDSGTATDDEPGEHPEDDQDLALVRQRLGDIPHSVKPALTF